MTPEQLQEGARLLAATPLRRIESGPDAELTAWLRTHAAELIADAARWRDSFCDPAGRAHLFSLLAQGKGTPEQLDKMADKIIAQRRAAIDAARASGTEGA